MPLSAFLQDAAALLKELPDGVGSVKHGECDGELYFTFTHKGLDSPIRLQILATNVDEYPRYSSFLVFTHSPQVPRNIEEVLRDMGQITQGMNVSTTVNLICKKFSSVLSGDSSAKDALDTARHQDGEHLATSQDNVEGGDDEDDDSCTCDYPTDGSIFDTLPDESFCSTSPLSHDSSHSRDRLRQDLAQASKTGLKIGIYSSDHPHDRYLENHYSISLKASKLGLSDEALQAWGLGQSEYVVLLISISGSYKSVQQLMASGRTVPGFRFGKCSHFKPSPASVVNAFSQDNDGRSSTTWNMDKNTSCEIDEPSFQPVYVSNTINRLLREDLLSLLKIRLRDNKSWDQARQVLWRLQNSASTPTPAQDEDPLEPENDVIVSSMAPSALNVDYVAQTPEGDLNLPLIAMQLSLRHFARCTEYCMVCHRKVVSAFEALKPYVCSRDLCLFHYMSLGLGPSIEFEIMRHPEVVDLLISFFYSTLTPSNATARKLLSTPPPPPLPTGLGLRVPFYGMNELGQLPSSDITVSVKWPYLTIGDGNTQVQPLKVGQWVVLRSKSKETTLNDIHCRISSGMGGVYDFEPVCMFSTSEHNFMYGGDIYSFTADEMHKLLASDKFQAELWPYDQDPDQMSGWLAHMAIAAVLNTLPSVSDMRKFLAANRKRSLASWSRISPAAFTLLRWIVASNRSSLVLINDGQPTSPTEAKTDTGINSGTKGSTAEASGTQLKGSLPPPATPSARDDKVAGMPPHLLQLRFAQGSPDKENQFSAELFQLLRGHKIPHKYPTMFAWHGSPVFNWHSIIREGLNFKNILNGRSFGNGVYFSPTFSVSQGYAMRQTSPYCFWPNCGFRISSVVGLCEILNCPNDFVCTQGCYVVNKVDWIQCRYLFICPEKVPNVALPVNSRSPHVAYLELDPARIPLADAGVISIPASAVPRFRRGLRNLLSAQESGIGRDGETPSYFARNLASATEEQEYSEQEQDDSALLLQDIELPAMSSDSKRRRPLHCDAEKDNIPTEKRRDSKVVSCREFIPGSLDYSGLPRLPQPNWSTTGSLQTISKEIAQLQQTQARAMVRSQLAELGWYVNFERIDNLFHWIAELHSFDAALPLARDMGDIGATSVIVEVRIGRDFPISPPFVRVVRPRFLPFLNGGGGHVTAGGAMCLELLTTSGWSPACSLEAVLVQVRAALCSLDPQPARLEARPGISRADYSVAEAVMAFRRAATAHRWGLPADLDSITAETWG